MSNWFPVSLNSKASLGKKTPHTQKKLWISKGHFYICILMSFRFVKINGNLHFSSQSHSHPNLTVSMASVNTLSFQAINWVISFELEV